jgi:hypothetical protein
MARCSVLTSSRLMRSRISGVVAAPVLVGDDALP